MKFKLEVGLNDAGMQLDCGSLDRPALCEVLENCEIAIMMDLEKGNLKDSNGNTIGKWEIIEDV
ncbi:hypothetical protein LCGC14_1184150 [marine sediment metagenome]|uniref:Uncharacterized protein n=1 Tax=marine sediment metagenome TaxID=412755 RepID=A0A0F9P471_9ZZZZ|nr:hypothetical protein [Candidatus Aminicenantes bacterium]